MVGWSLSADIPFADEGDKSRLDRFGGGGWRPHLLWGRTVRIKRIDWID